ncbi:hypothetical protein [Primorskyibacter flagellatus]|uniref:hypothetical protein n=1 Tax=Primorskyibacter flagellatus TaxID=1387277 RepID=UPI003A93C49A
MAQIRNLLAACAVFFGAALSASAAPQLVMVERDGCHWCEAWNEVIAPIYPKTDAGAFAPLLRADLYEEPPEGVRFDRPVSFTPTFILVDDGRELGRIEGYPGEEFFWVLLEKLLTDTTSYEAGS